MTPSGSLDIALWAIGKPGDKAGPHRLTVVLEVRSDLNPYSTGSSEWSGLTGLSHLDPSTCRC